ncbi:MAG: STAS domain-containing protein [Patescibacteria group bacterium]|nr:STAS domain-containing protein [Patescibacteria group bacterium]
MNLPTEVFDDVVVVHAPEELASDQRASFAACVCGLDRTRVVIDLDNTETLDSKGLEAILEIQDRLHGAGGGVRLAATNPVNRKIFEITRLDRQIEMFDSVVDAVRSFR